jgi:hypothetical protein
MCLTNISEQKTATEDIVVYKHLKTTPGFDISDIDDKPFKCMIDGIDVEGHIKLMSDNVYFLHNVEIRRGSDIGIHKGDYLYSWVLDSQVDLKTLEIDGELVEENTNYITPYQDTNVLLGKTYYSDLRVYSYKGVQNGVTDVDHHAVDRGLHSFAEKQDAFDDIYPQGIVVKCIIPKGSKYFEGVYSEEYRSYASDTLQYTTEIWKNE